MEYIAHINEKTKEEQSVYEHSINTAHLAEKFSIDSLKELNYAAGLLHDLGKLQMGFQRRIRGEENIRIEHALCGAIEAKQLYQNAPVVSCILQYCIMGHHSGLPDGGAINDTADMPTLAGRLKRKYQEYEVYKAEITPPAIDGRQLASFLIQGCKEDKRMLAEKFAFITRYCFSCLTDADSLDTADFCSDEPHRELVSDFSRCLEKIDAKFNSFRCETPLQRSRSAIQRQVYDKLECESEIFLMNMPTGSGKTLCSMKYALSRALRYGRKRIIYVIPYNSIIDQTAELLEELFGDSAEILRHQSSFSYDEYDAEEDYKRLLKAAEENWNAQIIITTFVQFFESVYANKRGKLRKLHNMANSVIIFDEAHLMPIHFLKPCLQAVAHITSILNSEAIFLTATMPDFKRLLASYGFDLQRVTDLVEDTALFENFKKCSYQDIGSLSEEMLAQKALEDASTLVVVNTKLTARKLYSLCKKSGQRVYHLSTYMSAYDRKRTIQKIKEELSSLQQEYPELEGVPSERKITVISTSLIEAGVDLDFFSVYRELAGLDNVLQAGGRCNREGKLENAKVYVFTLEERADRVLKDERANLLKGLLKEYDDISDAECIREYYNRLFFSSSENTNGPMISDDSTDIWSLKFAAYARKFELIDSDAVSIVVERDDLSKRLVDAIKRQQYVNHRQLQKYTFSINEREFADLKEQGVINSFGSNIWCLMNRDYYEEDTGVQFEARDY
ncbi:MAG: CRISPR-associated helicase Cas3' [Lachnospiraceae bacterium]|nr:CRISPR-associated helicase Cas3' [Lachnospiraceae bacterium]